MHCRTPDQLWSQFARPFIFVPASFLSDHDSHLGYHPHLGQDEEKPRNSETLPGSEALDSSSTSSFSSPLLCSSQTSDLPMGDNLLAPSVEKSTARGRLRKARLADTKGVTRAEDIPEYKGQMSVDDLVEFINSGRARQKDATKTKTRNNIVRNNSKKRLHECFETGLKLEVRSGKLSGEMEAEEEEEQMKEPGKTDSKGNKGVNPDDVLDLDSEASDVAWNDFTIVSRKKKGKTQLNQENSPNEVNLTFDIKGRTGFNRENNTNEMNLTSDVRVRTRFNWENSPSEVNFTPQVNQSCPQVERIRKLKGNKQSIAVMCENKSIILNTQDSSAQDMTSSQSRMVTAVQDVADKVNPAFAATCQSSKNGSNTSSQKPSRDLQIERKHHSIHQTGSHDYESRVSQDSSIPSPSTKVASDTNSETKGQAAKSSYLCPPVVFTNRNHTEFEKLVDISFGFDVQDAESGLEESANCVGNATADCSSASNGCRCSHEGVTSCTDKKLSDKSPPVLLTSNSSDENNHSYEATRNTTAQSDTYADSETKKVLTCARSLINTTYQHNSISKNGKVEKHKADSTIEEKKATMCTLDKTASAKEHSDKMLSSDKFEVQQVNCIAQSKKNLTASAKTKKVTNSVNVRVISADLCAMSLSSTGRPVSVVAPNQCSSGQSSCSGYGSSSSGHSESPSLSSVKSECSSPNFCSSLVHSSPSSSCHGSSTILGPCARAPVVKVAPMPVEKLVSTEDPFVRKSNSRCEERMLEDDRSSPCNTFTEDEGVHELSFLTEGCDLVKLESGPCEHDYKVHRQEPFSHKQDCNFHKQESCSQKQDCNFHKQESCSQKPLLHKLDCDFVKHCLQRTPCSLATKSDRTVTDTHLGTNSHPLGNAFDLVSAQIYLYKLYEEVPAIHQDPLE